VSTDLFLKERLAAQDLEQRSVNAIRVLSLDAVERAQSGHPGTPMGLADVAYVLWSSFLRFDPTRPDWPNRDRFVLSAGHACMLQYAMLYLLGYDLSLEDLRQFRQFGSRTPGHPEKGHTVGVETTSGPLGQGISTAVGMAIAERHLAARLNTPGFNVIDHRTVVIASDGDMMEGVQAEAASVAGHLGLGKLIVIYDDNRITIDGSTSLAFSTEDVAARYAAYGWHVTHVDGHDRKSVHEALLAADAESERPSLIVARTHIAIGAPTKQDTAEAHGSPLGAEEVKRVREAYGWHEEPFVIPEAIHDHFLEMGRAHFERRKTWEETFANWKQRFPERAAIWDAIVRPAPPSTDEGRPSWKPGTMVPTRKASHKALEWLKPRVPSMLGGSADLTPSNLTETGEDASFSKDNPAGRYFHFGVREHAMAAIMNGLALSGLRPYGGTFLIFSDYLRPSLRLASIMQTPVVYVFTHDSIFLGEDGPTHQPIAALAALRAIPGMTVIRPADAPETLRAWEVALERGGPVALCLTRQDVPVLDHDAPEVEDDLRRGAYILFGGGGPADLIAFATGSEVWVTLEAARAVAKDGLKTRVVAVPSWELFFEQDADYQRRILAPEITARLAVEAASPFGWERFVGMNGVIHGINRFGASAPWKVLQKEFGFTPDAIADMMRRLVRS
jgi:transketolase